VDPAVVGEVLAVDLAAVEEAIGEAPAVDPMAVGEVMAVQAGRRSMSGYVGGGEMIVDRVCRGDTNVRSITSYITIVSNFS
jgi:hypothetical protein